MFIYLYTCLNKDAQNTIREKLKKQEEQLEQLEQEEQLEQQESTNQ
jgi:hypothetical protein